MFKQNHNEAAAAVKIDFEKRKQKRIGKTLSFGNAMCIIWLSVDRIKLSFPSAFRWSILTN